MKPPVAYLANLDGPFNLRLRSFGKETRYLLIVNSSVPYGQGVIRQAVRSQQAILYRSSVTSKAEVYSSAYACRRSKLLDLGFRAIEIDLPCFG
jgi:hypothetical protein